jgi:two-component system, OmpR family, sensor kinase
MSRLPIRLRVTLAFTAVMAVILAAVGSFVYVRLGPQIDESIDDGLRSRAADLTALVRASGELGGTGDNSLISGEDSFAQVLTTDGQIVETTPQLRQSPVLSSAEAQRAASEPVFIERDDLPGVDGSARLLAAPVTARGERLVAVVGSSLDNRSEALSGLARLLLIGGPAALLLAALAGYGATAAALRPVEAMRRRAAAISASEPGDRLPVPAAEDELSRLGKTLNEMLGRLEAALERERRFVDDASHELRTPLALHKTELEVALRYDAGAEELRAAIASAIEEVDRLIQLAEGMLVVARSEGGELPVEPEPVAVADLLGLVEQRFEARARQAGRELVVAAGNGLVVTGDRLRLEQALTSMVDNALRHGEGEVRIWARRNGTLIELHVSDQGPGFPPGFAAQAFERFSRADPARARGGAGLGLAIVETIARAHHGRAEVANAPGGGADVWIALPPA